MGSEQFEQLRSCSAGPQKRGKLVGLGPVGPSPFLDRPYGTPKTGQTNAVGPCRAKSESYPTTVGREGRVLSSSHHHDRFTPPCGLWWSTAASCQDMVE